MKISPSKLYKSLIITSLLSVGFLTYAHEGEPHIFSARDNSASSDMERTSDKESFREKIQEKRDDLMQKRQDIRQNRTENRCRVRSTVITNRLNMLDKAHKFHVQRFQNLHDRLTKVIQRLKEKDIDTTKLESDLAKLKTMLVDLEEKHKTMTESISALKEIPCDETVLDDGFKEALQKVKVAVEDLRDSAEEVKMFIEDTIKPDLVEIREQLKATESSTETTESQ